MTALLAKRLVEPTWSSVPEWRFTYGPAVADLAAQVWHAPDPEQELVLDGIFAVGNDGNVAAFEVDIIAARQQLKTAVITMAELGWIYVTDQGLILHTAHRSFAVESAFRGLRKIIRGAPALSKRLAPGRSKGITTGNGAEAIEFATGQRIQFATRTGDTGRSESVDRLVIDEAYAETEEQSGAILPTMGAAPDPQMVRASSACKLTSDVLRDVRDRGRAKSDPRQAYYEYGDPDAWTGCLRADCDHAKTAHGCALDDEKRWEKILPALDRRTSRATVRGFRQSMSPKEFAREIMVWHDDPPKVTGQQVFGEHWETQALEDGERPKVLALGLAVEVDRAWASIAAAGDYESGEKFVGAVDRRRGATWSKAEVARIALELKCPVILDGKGPAGKFVEDLEADGVQVIVAGGEDVLDAASGLYDGITETHDIWHMDDDDLNDAVAGAALRNVGDRFCFGRRKSLTDVSMLEAASLARWGATNKLRSRIPMASFA